MHSLEMQQECVLPESQGARATGARVDPADREVYRGPAVRKHMIAEAPPWRVGGDLPEVVKSDLPEVGKSIDREYRQDVRTPAGGKGSPTVAYSPTRAGGADDDGEFVFLPADDPRAFEADEGGD